MKRQELKDLGLTDEQIEKVMDLNGADINQTKASNTSKITELESTVESLTKSNTELGSKIESYKDYEELKTFKADYLAKEENSRKIEFLKKQGCKNPELFVSQVDWSKGKYENETFTGLDESVKGLKEKYVGYFEKQGMGTPNINATGGKATDNSLDDLTTKYLEAKGFKK